MQDKITEEQIFEDYQDGLPEDFSLEGAKIRRKPVNLEGATVQISLPIDYALLKDIKQAADQQGLPYKAFIMQILRDYCKRTDVSASAPSHEISH